MYKYINHLADKLKETKVTSLDSKEIELDRAIRISGDMANFTNKEGGKVIFIGNGGSAGISSHMAIDYSKNGGIRATSFNDGAALTCLGNDFGYEYVFSKQIEFHANEKDILIAISSSGNSKNILLAVEAARAKGIKVITLSGFGEGNLLRKLGDINFYIPDTNYGFVEIGHLTIIHAVLDINMGWE